jgi:hypothetical protein
MSLPKEFGIPGKFDGLPRWCEALEFSREHGSRASRDGGLANDKARRVQQRSEGGDTGFYLRQVGTICIRALRRANAHKMNLAERRSLLVRRGESKSTRIDAAPEQRFQPGLEEWKAPAGEAIDPNCVGINTKHLETHISQACGVRGTKVTGPENGQPRMLGHIDHVTYPFLPYRVNKVQVERAVLMDARPL